MKCGSYHEEFERCAIRLLCPKCGRADKWLSNGPTQCSCGWSEGDVLQSITPRESILQEATEHVIKNRQATHGNPEQSFSDIAALWTWYKGVDFTPTDVAMMQALLKIARQKTTPTHRDNYVDLAGYASCAGEMAQLKQEGTP